MEKGKERLEEKKEEKSAQSKKWFKKVSGDKTKTHWETRLFPTPVSKWKRILPYGIILLVVVAGYLFLSRYLAPSVGSGAILITSNPTGAIVYINGQDYGRTPLEIGKIPAKEYNFRIARAGYSKWERKVTVSPGKRVDIRAELLESLTSPAAAPVVPMAEAEVAVPYEFEREVKPALEVKPTLEEIRGGGFKISSNPSGAAVFIDNEPQKGRTPLEAANLEPGRHLVRLVKQGYKTWEDEVVVENEVISDLDVRLELLPGYVKITSLPNQAEVYLDEEYKGKTPLTLKDVRGGKSYMIRVSVSDYRDWESRVIVDPGQTVNLSAKLERMVTGALLIASMPKNAKVYVDGEFVGRTPLVGIKLEVGDRQIRVLKEGYATLEKKVRVLEENNPPLNFELKETVEVREEGLAGKPGALFITSEPAGADVDIDGVSRKGQTPMAIPEIETGEHQVKVSKSGYLPVKKVIIVHSGASATSNFILKEGKEEIPEGHISVATNPPKCKLYLDGEYKGTTPLTISSRREWEPYEIRLTAEGYKDWLSKIFVGPGQTFVLKADLKKNE